MPPPTGPPRGLHILSGGEPVEGDYHWKAQRARQDFRLCMLVVVLGVVAFFCASLAPGLTGLAMLLDPTYVFFAGRLVPCALIVMSFLVPVLLASLGVFALRRAPAERLNEYTLAAAAAAVAALLGIGLIALAAVGARPLRAYAADLSPMCSGTAKVAALQNYSQALQELRRTPACAPAMLDSVENCTGWESNKYTAYLRYLEAEFQCGHFCPVAPDGTALRAQPREEKAAEERHGRRHWRRQQRHGGASLLLAEVGNAGRSSHKRVAVAEYGSADSSTRDLGVRKGPGRFPLQIGDAVVVEADAGRVTKEFRQDPAVTWNADLMQRALGKQLRVIALPGNGLVGVHSLDGSQGGVWYFPADTVRKAVLPGFPYIPSAEAALPLFTRETSSGPARQAACAPLVASRLEATVFWLQGSLLGAGFLLIFASLATAAAPVVAGACCK